MDEIEFNGKKYVLASSVKRVPAVSVANKKYVIVRTYTAGVFAGYLKSRKDKEVVLVNARRIHYWDGAASLSELAMRGSSKPQNCRFPAPVDEVILTEVIEILAVTKEAQKNIESVKVWTA